ncbi:MAG TPA: hypothetical protein VKV20_12025 [Ktedonobacteraceae bacterium]|jgi:hypothetical protein|nr:hypothetical protein [Ktedonobacteraceae bacterium]
MYELMIRAQVDASVFPYELKNVELAEMTIEGAVACVLEKLFLVVNMREVTMTPSSREYERDWDSLLSQDC